MRKGAADQGDEGRRHPRVELLTRAELESRRARLIEHIKQVEDLPAIEVMRDELDNLNWLLGDTDGDH